MEWELDGKTYISIPREDLFPDDMSYYRHLRAKAAAESLKRVGMLRHLLNKAKVKLLSRPCPIHPEHYAVQLFVPDEMIKEMCPIQLFLWKGRVLIEYGGWQDWLATEPLKAILRPIDE